ncbi:hypothetical protein MKZ38_009135 [Zalerion maritima]|uniref:WW domain-containing protein n=1 Tax=Zalerion maritima TaxID=339359 RepID=A0AAD5WN96_9PEZI|nr:hypothetical protein MKZ38_009135 [Zalerion maritima]
MSSALPEGWEWDYDGSRWFYRYKPSGIIQYHFPTPGDEFPDYVGSDAPPVSLAPEEMLESQKQIGRSSTSGSRTGARRRSTSNFNSVAGPVSTTFDEDYESSGGQFKYEDFMYLGPVSPIEEDKDDNDWSLPTAQSGNVSVTPSPGPTPSGQAAAPVISREPIVSAPPQAQNSFVMGDPGGFVVSAPVQAQESAHSAQGQLPVMLENTALMHELPPEPARQNPLGFVAELADPGALADIEVNPPPVELQDTSNMANMPAELPDMSMAVTQDDRREELREAQKQRQIDAEAERMRLGLDEGGNPRSAPGGGRQLESVPETGPSSGMPFTEQQLRDAQRQRQIDAEVERKRLGLDGGAEATPGQPQQKKYSAMPPPTSAPEADTMYTFAHASASTMVHAGVRSQSVPPHAQNSQNVPGTQRTFTPMPPPVSQSQQPPGQTTTTISSGGHLPQPQSGGFQIKRKPTNAKYTPFVPSSSSQPSSATDDRRSSMVLPNVATAATQEQELGRIMTGSTRPTAGTTGAPSSAMPLAGLGQGVPPKVPVSSSHNDVPSIIAPPVPRKEPLVEGSANIPGARARHESIVSMTSGPFHSAHYVSHSSIPSSLHPGGPIVGINHSNTFDNGSPTATFGPASAPTPYGAYNPNVQNAPGSPIPSVLSPGLGPGRNQAQGQPAAATALPPHMRQHLNRLSTDFQPSNKLPQSPVAGNPMFQAFRMEENPESQDPPPIPSKPTKQEDPGQYPFPVMNTPVETKPPSSLQAQPAILPYPVTPKMGSAAPAPAPEDASRPSLQKAPVKQSSIAPYPEEVRPSVSSTPYPENMSPASCAPYPEKPKLYPQPLTVRGSRSSVSPPINAETQQPPPLTTGFSIQPDVTTSGVSFSVHDETHYQPTPPSSGSQPPPGRPSMVKEDSEVSALSTSSLGTTVSPAQRVPTGRIPAPTPPSEGPSPPASQQPPRGGSDPQYPPELQHLQQMRKAQQASLQQQSQGVPRPISVKRPISTVSSIGSPDPDRSFRPLSTVSEIEPTPRPEEQYRRSHYNYQPTSAQQQHQPYVGFDNGRASLNSQSSLDPPHTMGRGTQPGPQGPASQRQHPTGSTTPGSQAKMAISRFPHGQALAGQTSHSGVQEVFHSHEMADQRYQTQHNLPQGPPIPAKIPNVRQQPGSFEQQRRISTPSASPSQQTQGGAKPPSTPAVNKPLPAPNVSPMSIPNESSRPTSMVQIPDVASTQDQSKKLLPHSQSIVTSSETPAPIQAVQQLPGAPQSQNISGGDSRPAFTGQGGSSSTQEQGQKPQTPTAASPPTQSILEKMQAQRYGAMGPPGLNTQLGGPVQGLATPAQGQAGQNHDQTPISGTPQSMVMGDNQMTPPTSAESPNEPELGKLKKQSTAKKLFSKFSRKGGKEAKQGASPNVLSKPQNVASPGPSGQQPPVHQMPPQNMAAQAPGGTVQSPMVTQSHGQPWQMGRGHQQHAQGPPTPMSTSSMAGSPFQGRPMHIPSMPGNAPDQSQPGQPLGNQDSAIPTQPPAASTMVFSNIPQSMVMNQPINSQPAPILLPQAQSQSAESSGPDSLPRQNPGRQISSEDPVPRPESRVSAMSTPETPPPQKHLQNPPASSPAPTGKEASVHPTPVLGRAQVQPMVRPTVVDIPSPKDHPDEHKSSETQASHAFSPVGQPPLLDGGRQQQQRPTSQHIGQHSQCHLPGHVQSGQPYPPGIISHHLQQQGTPQQSHLIPEQPSNMSLNLQQGGGNQLISTGAPSSSTPTNQAPPPMPNAPSQEPQNPGGFLGNVGKLFRNASPGMAPQVGFQPPYQGQPQNNGSSQGPSSYGHHTVSHNPNHNGVPMTYQIQDHDTSEGLARPGIEPGIDGPGTIGPPQKPLRQEPKQSSEQKPQPRPEAIAQPLPLQQIAPKLGTRGQSHPLNSASTSEPQTQITRPGEIRSEQKPSEVPNPSKPVSAILYDGDGWGDDDDLWE